MGKGLPSALAVALGAGVWVAIALFSGRNEAWDSRWYWTAGYPALALGCSALAWLWPKGWKLWPLAAMLGQFAALIAVKGLGGLWPLGLILMGIMALPLMIPAGICARIKSRRVPSA